MAVPVSTSLWSSMCLLTVTATARTMCPWCQMWAMFASFDPVALDQACADAVVAQPALPGSMLFDEACACNKGDHFKRSHPNSDWNVCLEHAEKLGLGRRAYKLVRI